MSTKLLGFFAILALLALPILPAYVVAENEPGPHDEGDLDGDVDVDMNDVDLLGLFLNGTLEPTKEQFWRADIYPYTLNGSELCPQWDGELTNWDYFTLEYIADRHYSFAWEEDCPYYDFDHDGYIDYRSGGDDCDDWRDFVNPGAIEECGAPTCSDNFDNDCDGVKDAADPDCRKWCPTAAEASILGSSKASKSVNSALGVLLPVGFIAVLRKLQRKR